MGSSVRFVMVVDIEDARRVMVEVMFNVTLVVALAPWSIICNSLSTSKITMTTMSLKRLICQTRKVWITHDFEDFIPFQTGKKLILDATGQELLNETAYRIGPIFNFYVNEINQESAKLIYEHQTKWPEVKFSNSKFSCWNSWWTLNSEACHLQKHSLYSVPVSEVQYRLEDDEVGRFWVYGLERSVFSFDYPAQCCCCCICNQCCNNCSCCNSCAILWSKSHSQKYTIKCTL